jgi:hypothetical protein
MRACEADGQAEDEDRLVWTLAVEGYRTDIEHMHDRITM